MDLQLNRRTVLIGLGLMIATLVGCSACEKSKLPTPPVLVGLDIGLYQHPQEANIHENVYLSGSLYDNQGVSVVGAQVTFTVTPDSVGDITPFANTNPDSATGFSTRVTFYGKKPGIALITGQVIQGTEVLGRDTVRIRVRDPING